MNKFWFAQILSILAFSVFMISCSDEENDIAPPNNDLSDNTAFSLITNAYDSTDVENEGEFDLEEECFTFTFPITVLNPDNTTQVVNSEDELYGYIDEWLMANPDSEDYPTFQFPIDITLTDGTVKNINSDEELCDVLHECFGEEWDEDYDDEDYDDEDYDDEDYDDDYDDDELIEMLTACYEISFPISLIVDSTQITINSIEELIEVATQSDYHDVEVIYPIELTDLNTQESFIVNSDDELEDALYDCYDEEGDILGSCFDFVYPIDITIDDNSVVNIQNAEELYAAFDSNEDVEFVFPLTITLLSDSSTVSVNDEDELEDLLEEECGSDDID